MAIERPKEDQGKSARRWDEILDAATVVLNGRGLSASLLNDLAQTLGVTREALYYYVSDREDLVFRAYERSCAAIAGSLDLAEADAGDALSKIHTFVHATLAPDAPELACLSAIGVLPDEKATLIGEMLSESAARLARILNDGAASGSLRALDSDLAARTIIALVQWQSFLARRNVLLGETAIGRADYVRVLVDLLDRGWATPRSLRNDIEVVDPTMLIRTTAVAFDREALNAAKREMILLAAARLVNRRGVESVSMDRIAEEIGASKRSIYGLIGDKAAVIRASRKRTHDILSHIATAAVAMGGTPAEQFVRTLRSAIIVQLNRDIEPMMATPFYEGMSDDERQIVAQNFHEMHDLFREQLRALFAEGSARLVDFAVASQIIGGAQVWLTSGLVAIEERDARHVATKVTDLLRLGLAPL